MLGVVRDMQSGRFAENGDGARVEADDSNHRVSVAQSGKCYREEADGLDCREYREGSQKRMRQICRRQLGCCFMKTAGNETLSWESSNLTEKSSHWCCFTKAVKGTPSQVNVSHGSNIVMM